MNASEHPASTTSEKSPLRAIIRGTGSAVPKRVMTNDELATLVDTNDEWIVQRTGIRERRVSGPGETASGFAIEAAEKALAKAGWTADTLDLIIVATVSGDYIWPATACLVQEKLGASRAAAYDISAACAGFIYALANADAMARTGMVQRALVIGVDCLTRQMDWTDRSTCILFGDAAAAVVVESASDGDRGVVQTFMRADGGGHCHIIMEAGGTKYPIGSPEGEGKSNHIFMAGSEVFRFAVNAMGDACEQVLNQAGITADEVDLFVPHQANIRIIEAAAKRLQLPAEKIFINVDRYGNTSGASIPLALDEAVSGGKLKPGMLVMTVGFGAGLVWGANLIRW